MEMMPSKVLSLAEVAFGASNMTLLLPPYEAVPKDFKDDHNKWAKFIEGWFFDGVNESVANRLRPKDGVDRRLALDHLSAVMRSFTPSHAHKIAGCANLASLWFVDVP